MNLKAECELTCLLKSSALVKEFYQNLKYIRMTVTLLRVQAPEQTEM